MRNTMPNKLIWSADFVKIRNIIFIHYLLPSLYCVFKVLWNFGTATQIIKFMSSVNIGIVSYDQHNLIQHHDLMLHWDTDHVALKFIVLKPHNNIQSNFDG